MSSRPDVVRYYSSIRVRTANNSRLICMLHNHCVKILKEALISQSHNRNLLDKAQNIITQLERSLVLDDSLSQGLFFLYDYCYSLLENGSIEEIASSLSMITNLASTFNDLLSTHQEKA